MATEALGIHQSDLVIRTAIIAAINDLRANPYLLDYVFASLPADTLTASEYGTQQVQKAKDWFMKTNIKVFMNVNLNQVQFPCISIGLASSIEDETTLGDVHYVPRESVDMEWPTLAGPMSVASYDPETGELIFDESKLDGLVLAPGLLVVDKRGGQHIIQSVLSDISVTIEKGLQVDFEDCQIKPQKPAQVMDIESNVYREVYSIGCHVDSESVHCTYLHSIVVFALLRYKEQLLEARGFERSSLSSSDFRRDEESMPEFIYSRYIQVTGFVRQAWPKNLRFKTSGVRFELVASNPPDTQIANLFNANEGLQEDGTEIPGASPATSVAYYAEGPVPGAIDEAFVLSMSAFSTPTRQTVIHYNLGPGQYAWYVIPTTFGGTPGDFIDDATAEPAGMSIVAQVTVKNVLCNVWRSDLASLGVLTIVVL